MTMTRSSSARASSRGTPQAVAMIRARLEKERKKSTPTKRKTGKTAVTVKLPAELADAGSRHMREVQTRIQIDPADGVEKSYGREANMDPVPYEAPTNRPARVLVTVPLRPPGPTGRSPRPRTKKLDLDRPLTAAQLAKIKREADAKPDNLAELDEFLNPRLKTGDVIPDGLFAGSRYVDIADPSAVPAPPVKVEVKVEKERERPIGVRIYDRERAVLGGEKLRLPLRPSDPQYVVADSDSDSGPEDIKLTPRAPPSSVVDMKLDLTPAVAARYDSGEQPKYKDFPDMIKF